MLVLAAFLPVLLVQGCSTSLWSTPPVHAAAFEGAHEVPADVAGLTPVVSLSGLKYYVIKAGTGATARPGQTVQVHYVGFLATGSKKFDASYDRAKPLSFALGAGRVIKGWDEGVAGMMVGEQRQLHIPASLGYGVAGAGGLIPPNASLVFDVELVAIQ